ncbi:MAG: hypothetical protein Q4B43_08965 [Bacteroidota bacterium]|nr:hypothetical protein [Bacteroidota bacterium]
MILHKFSEIPTNYKEVRHYQRIHGIHTPNVKEFTNISVQRHFNNSKNVSFWYKTAHKENGKRGAWSNPITGLFSTKYKGVYYGDIQENGRKKQLLIFVFDECFKNLSILEYPSYPRTKEEVNNIVQSVVYLRDNDNVFSDEQHNIQNIKPCIDNDRLL